MNIFSEDLSLDYFEWIDAVNEALCDDALIAKVDGKYL